MQSARQARRGILVFIAALAAATFVSIWLRERVPWPRLPTVAFPMLMTTLLSYSPAIASLIARISLRENTKDVSFRLRGDWSAKSVADRLVLACVSGLGTYGVAWILASCVLPGLPLVRTMARGDRRI